MIISVIIPVYNVENYLRECLESVMAQSGVDMEVLLINDGSTDSSGEICKEYEENYANVQLITKENEGLSAARNTGIHYAVGDYLIFLDSDDYWDGDFLAELEGYINENKKLEYVFFRCKYYYQNKKVKQEQQFSLKRKKIQQRNGQQCLDYILTEVNDYQWMAVLGIVKRDFLIRHLLYFEKGRSFEDALWTPEVFLRAAYVDYYDASVYVYRLEREGQITSNFSYKHLADNIYIPGSWHQKLKLHPISKELKHKLMYNLSRRYFFAIWFGGFTPKEDKGKLLALLEDNKYLLDYSEGRVRRVTVLFCNIVGLKKTISLFKIVMQIKRRLSKRRAARKV